MCELNVKENEQERRVQVITLVWKVAAVAEMHGLSEKIKGGSSDPGLKIKWTEVEWTKTLRGW